MLNDYMQKRLEKRKDKNILLLSDCPDFFGYICVYTLYVHMKIKWGIREEEEEEKV